MVLLFFFLGWKYILDMYYPYKVIVQVGSAVYEGFGKKEDNSEMPRTAKRILLEQANIKVRFVKYVGPIGSMPIEDVPEDIKQGWPKGLKTINVFHYSVESNS